jgi:Mg2+ and Co2+ transporter CorA
MLEMYFKTVRDHDFQQIASVRPGCLIYSKETKQEDLTKICELTGLTLPDIRDCLDRFELSRVERIEENIILFIRHPTETEYGLYTDTLTLILTPQYVIVISPDRSEVFEHLLASKSSIATTQKAKLTLNTLLKVTQDYTSNIKRVRHTILDHEQKMKIVDTDAITLMTNNEEILRSSLCAIRSNR